MNIALIMYIVILMGNNNLKSQAMKLAIWAFLKQVENDPKYCLTHSLC